jgi:peptidoglycan/xylan/chitin deacetylase (PgdA/CDA1 family)
MKPVFSLLSPAGERARVQILIFHRVLREPDPLFPEEIDAARFDAICGWLRTWFDVLPLEIAARRLREGSLGGRAAVITFDDGYADNHDVALPVLLRHGLVASFFVATGFLDGGRMWNDTIIESVRRSRQDEVDGAPAGIDESLSLRDAGARRQTIDRVIRSLKHLHPAERAQRVDAFARICGVDLPTDLMMSSAQVQNLHRAGQRIGAHTVHHPILARLPAGEARWEVAQSRSRLQQLLDDPVSTFAYPNGQPGTDYSAESVAIVRESGFELAVSTAWGAADRSSDAFQLPRFTPWDRQRHRFALRLAGNYRRTPARV